MNKFRTRGQYIARWTVSAGIILMCLGVAAANLFVAYDCSPQAGKWTPWTGKICYGEEKE